MIPPPTSLVSALGAALFLTLLWFLSPHTTNENQEGGTVVEISFLGPAGPVGGSLADAVRVFEEESAEAQKRDPSLPRYRVISGQNASRDMGADPTRFLLSIAGKMPPDVVYFDRFAVAEWSTRGAFLDLTPWIAADEKAGRPDAVRREDYYPPTWDEVAFTNPITNTTGIYGVPDAFESRALVYNKDLLRRAGFVDAQGEAKPPATWEELEVMAKKLTETDETGRIVRLGFAPNYGSGLLYQYGWQNGGEILSPDGLRCTLNDPRFVEALDWTTRMYDQVGGVKAVKAFESTKQAADLDPFVSGRVAMKQDGYWIAQYTFAEYSDRLNYGVAPPPMPARELAAGRKPLGWIGGWCYSIPATARHPEAGWELIRFLTSPRARRIIAESERLAAQTAGRPYLPNQSAHRGINAENLQKYIEENPQLDPKLKEAVRTFNSLVEHSRFRPASPVGQVMFSEAFAATEAANYHTLSAQESLDRAAAASNSALQRVLNSGTGKEVNWSLFGWLYLALLGFGIWAILRWDTRPSRDQWLGGVFCAFPWIGGFLVFTGGPILFSIVISFCDYDILHPARWAGVSNYVRMFTEDHLLAVSAWNTIFMMIGIPIGMALSLAIAMLLNLEVRGIALWRTCFYIPSIVPAVASSILWIWIFNPEVGLLNSLLGAFGIQGPNWLQNTETSKPALILMGLWGAGGGMIIWLAGLKGISQSYYEAARIDGASRLGQFFHITLPLLSPYIFFNLIMGVIGTLQIFSQSFIMTQGGPVNSTMFYAYHLFNHAFRYLNMGYASAMAWVLVLVVLALTIFQMKLSKKWVHYEGD